MGIRRVLKSKAFLLSWVLATGISSALLAQTKLICDLEAALTQGRDSHHLSGLESVPSTHTHAGENAHSHDRAVDQVHTHTDHGHHSAASQPDHDPSQTTSGEHSHESDDSSDSCCKSIPSITSADGKPCPSFNASTRIPDLVAILNYKADRHSEANLRLRASIDPRSQPPPLILTHIPTTVLRI